MPGRNAFWGMASGTGTHASAGGLDEVEEARDSWEDGVASSWEDAVDGGPISAHSASATPTDGAGLGDGWIPARSLEKGKGPEHALYGVGAAAEELQRLTFEEGSPVAYKVATAVLSSSSLASEAHDGGEERVGASVGGVSKEIGVAAGASAEADGKGDEESKASCGTPALTSCGMARDESWVCAICHESIRLAETAQIKGCEHPYW